MGFFKISKPKENQPELINDKATSPPQPAETQTTQSSQRLFKTDVFDIFKYDLVPLEGGNALYGKAVAVYSYTFRELELSTFHQVDIVKHENGNYDLYFKSHTNQITEELARLIDICLNKLGPDFMHKGPVSEKDDRDLPLAAFSRLWFNKVRIENPDYTISLVLYNIQGK